MLETYQTPPFEAADFFRHAFTSAISALWQADVVGLVLTATETNLHIGRCGPATK